MRDIKSGDVYSNVSDFEYSDELKFAILNKLDRIWEYYPEEKFINIIGHITNIKEWSSISNTEFTKILDKYIEENAKNKK